MKMLFAKLVSMVGVEKIEEWLNELKHANGTKWDWIWSHTNNKSFGLEVEKWVEKNSQLERMNGHEQGFDFMMNGKKIELKSARNWDNGKAGEYNPKKSFTFNQVKPQYSDYHLFLGFHKQEMEIWFIPNEAFEEISKSYQHQGECYTVMSSQKNRKLMEKYKLKNLEEIKVA